MIDIPTKLAEWRLDHVRAVEELWPRMKGKLDRWQVKGLRYCSLRKREKRLAMSASAGVGKSSLMAWEGWIRLLCYGEKGEHPQGIAIAVDGKNLRANLRKEMMKWYQECPLLQKLFEFQSDTIRSREFPGTWFLEFRSFPRSASEDEKGASLSGLHSLYPFLLIDESALIPVLVGLRAEQAFSVMTDGLIVQAGNPMSQKGCLYDAVHRRKDMWHAIHISSDPMDPDRCQRISADWAQQQIDAAALGREDPWVMAYILGQFPKTAINQLLTTEDIEQSMARSPDPKDYDWAPRVLGIDVGGEGFDKNIICKRQGAIIYPLIDLGRGMNSTDGATEVARTWASWSADACFIDNGGGFGGAWRDRLVGYGYQATGVTGSSRAPDRRFYNMRASCHWNFAQWVKEGGALPKDAELQEELEEQTYVMQADKLLMEDKKLIAKRLGRSPNKVDACGYTFALPVAPKPNPYDHIQHLRNPGKVKTGLPGR